jgi:hypothetical protein
VRVYKQWYIFCSFEIAKATDAHIQVDKYEGGVFGICPRVYCVGCNVVPCGRSDMPGLDTVKLFCPNCNDIYGPPSSRFLSIDGGLSNIVFSLSSHYDRSINEACVSRGIFWNYVCTFVLPELPRARSGTILEAPFTLRIFTLARSLTTKCYRK